MEWVTDGKALQTWAGSLMLIGTVVLETSVRPWQPSEPRLPEVSCPAMQVVLRIKE